MNLFLKSINIDLYVNKKLQCHFRGFLKKQNFGKFKKNFYILYIPLLEYKRVAAYINLFVLNSRYEILAEFLKIFYVNFVLKWFKTIFLYA